MTNAIANQIWSGFTNPNQIDKSTTFSGCDFLLLNALSVGRDNFEIAASIVVNVIADTLYLNGSVQVPQAPLGKKEIPLEISYFDTALIVALPSEATRSQCECQVCLTTSYSVNLEIFSVSKKALCDCKLELDQIQSDVNFLKLLTGAIGVNQVAQDVVLLATATVIGAGLALPTAGASLALPPAAGAALTPASGALIPILVSAGFAIAGG
ncbi:hypothetical protein V2H45_05925 [Tumidithrix elongata RA019]|uniref:Uncharacterized protein n=1 Tax=Tumidithrix elongata BACA0141 TaxID=2716417 RepID=A0AAW9PXE5_9CYAN|nr:hypothetical protein [Tumidithrix elongata RA019]